MILLCIAIVFFIFWFYIIKFNPLMNVLVQSYNVKLSKVERRMSNLSRICIRCNYK